MNNLVGKKIYRVRVDWSSKKPELHSAEIAKETEKMIHIATKDQHVFSYRRRFYKDQIEEYEFDPVKVLDRFIAGRQETMETAKGDIEVAQQLRKELTGEAPPESED